MSHRLRLTGEVKSNKMEKTIIVEVSRKVRHPKYGKTMTRSKKYFVHSEEPIETGQAVTIEETKPMSKLKRWRVVAGKSDKKNDKSTKSTSKKK